jgi:plastin-1
LVWQIIKIGLLKEVTLEKHPELLRLKEGEEDISNLPPEELLLKWVNYHLKKADVAERVENFSSDLKVCFVLS